METSLTQQNPLQAVYLPKTTRAKDTLRKIVTVATGGSEFGVDTKLIRNVIQVGDASLVDDGQAMLLGDEKIPVFPLRDLVNDVIASSDQEAQAGKTLLIVRSASSQKSLAIRVDSVSRPTVIEDEKFYRLPGCVYGDQKNEFVESLALIQTDTDETELRLVINPLKAFGLDDQQAEVKGTVGHLKGVVVGDTNRSQGQMVVFSPVGIGNEVAFQFCLPLPFVVEIIQTNEKAVMPLPMALPKVAGMLMWRGIPVPVINLADQFNIAHEEASDSSDSRLMVCHLGQGQHVGFYTEAQIRTVQTPNSTQADVAWLFGMPKLAAVESADGVLVVPDLKTILNK